MWGGWGQCVAAWHWPGPGTGGWRPLPRDREDRRTRAQSAADTRGQLVIVRLVTSVSVRPSMVTSGDQRSAAQWAGSLMRKRYSDGGGGGAYPGYPGGSGGGRRRYGGGGERHRGWGAGGGGYRSRSSGPGARFNTIQGQPGGGARHPGHGQAGRYTGYRERTKSAPPGIRRHRSRSEDSGAMARRRSGERRTMTSFSLHPPETREGVRPVTPGRTKYDVDRQSSYYSRRAQSFIDKRYLPTWHEAGLLIMWWWLIRTGDISFVHRNGVNIAEELLYLGFKATRL